MDVLPETPMRDLPGFDDLSSRARYALSAASEILVYRDLIDGEHPRDHLNVRLLSLKGCGLVTEAEISAWVDGLSNSAPARPAVAGQRSCCGEPCETRFCPHCGKELNTFGLVSLRGYCRKFQRQAEKFLQGSKERLERARSGDDASVVEGAEKRLAANQHKLERWSSWVAALDEVLNGGTDGDS